ncbi:MAG: ATP-binding protein [Pseudomonadota bacterium]|nr:ATP-binding protein [Pseudomonadota bacterium]
MKIAVPTVDWSPSRITWVSLALTICIAAAIGVSGTALVLRYLQERLTAHGIEHNQEFAAAVSRLLHSTLAQATDRDDLSGRLQGELKRYQGMGYRIFLVDKRSHSLIADSEHLGRLPAALEETWLDEATSLDGHALDWASFTGAARHVNPDGGVHLLWLTQGDGGGLAATQRLLGVSRDEKMLHDFMGELRLQLDALLILTYALIALLGYFAVRGLGRAYERRLEAEVAARTRELEDAHGKMLSEARLVAIGRTAAMLTHEMRNPLASIKLALSGLSGSAGLGARELRRVRLVLGEVDRLNGLLSETLDYARPVKLSDAPLSLDRLIDEVLQLEEPLFREKELRIQRTKGSEGTRMRLDEAQMRQVLLNLLRNAAEASPAGGEVRIETRRESESLVLEMVNTGGPLDAETLHRAFEPFYTTKPKGTGLGLGLVKRVIEEHGGTVILVGEAPRTRLIVRLPISPV